MTRMIDQWQNDAMMILQALTHLLLQLTLS